MVRGSKGKGKKQSNGSGEDEIVIVSVRRRGRPQKQLIKDDNIEEEIEKMEEHGKSSVLKKHGGLEMGKKRKRNSKQSKDGDGDGDDDDDDDLGDKEEKKTEELKAVGFRQNGSRSRRKKNKPHRAAEVGVECK